MSKRKDRGRGEVNFSEANFGEYSLFALRNHKKQITQTVLPQQLHELVHYTEISSEPCS